LHLVVYYNGTEELISNPTSFPDVADPKSRVKEVQEPVVNATIIVPDGTNQFYYRVQTLTQHFR